MNRHIIFLASFWYAFTTIYAGKEDIPDLDPWDTAITILHYHHPGFMDQHTFSVFMRPFIRRLQTEVALPSLCVKNSPNTKDIPHYFEVLATYSSACFFVALQTRDNLAKITLINNCHIPYVLDTCVKKFSERAFQLLFNTIQILCKEFSLSPAQEIFNTTNIIRTANNAYVKKLLQNTDVFKDSCFQKILSRQ